MKQAPHAPYPPAPEPRDQEWTAIRRHVLARDVQRCTRCGERRPASELDVHHVIPRALGGTDDPANLTTLCDGCHAAKHPALQVSLARRFLERWAVRAARWLDGASRLPGESERIGAAMRALGVERLRDGQLEVILAALRGESVLFVSATGSGKSLCFQVPALLGASGTVVVSPLKALMTDQVVSLTERCIPATFLNSSLSRPEADARLQLIQRGGVKLLYVTPERLDLTRPAYGRNVVLGSRPSYLVVDEAHCVDRWGEVFRPSFLELGKARAALGHPPVLAFTATASAATQERILAALGVPGATRVVLDVDRPNITLLRAPDLEDDEGASLIRQLLSLPHGGRTLLFVQTLRRGRHLQELLRRRGVEIPFYHGQLPAPEREFLQQRFSGRLDPPLSTIICTNAFGMGIDVPDVRLVIHWGMPASPSDYVQEMGRAGRDGQAAVAVLLPRTDDDKLHSFMLRKSLPAEGSRGPEWNPEEYLRRREAELEVMNGMAEARAQCFRKLLNEHFGTDAPPTRQALTVRLMRWLYGARRAASQRGWCCDACSSWTGKGVVAVAAAALWNEPPPPRARLMPRFGQVHR